MAAQQHRGLNTSKLQFRPLARAPSLSVRGCSVGAGGSDARRPARKLISVQRRGRRSCACTGTQQAGRQEGGGGGTVGVHPKQSVDIELRKPGRRPGSCGLFQTLTTWPRQGGRHHDTSTRAAVAGFIRGCSGTCPGDDPLRHCSGHVPRPFTTKQLHRQAGHATDMALDAGCTTCYPTLGTPTMVEVMKSVCPQDDRGDVATLPACGPQRRQG